VGYGGVDYILTTVKKKGGGVKSTSLYTNGLIFL